MLPQDFKLPDAASFSMKPADADNEIYRERFNPNVRTLSYMLNSVLPRVKPHCCWPPGSECAHA